MVAYYTNETTGFKSIPVVKPASGAFGARVRRYRASFNLATVAGGIAVTTSDYIYLARIPAGAVFAFGVLNTSVSLGTSTLNIGLSQTHAANTQYATGLVLTSTNTPLLFGMVTDPGSSLGTTFTTLPYGQTATWGAYEMAAFSGPLPQRDVYLTVGTASLPSSSNPVVVDLYFSCE